MEINTLIISSFPNDGISQRAQIASLVMLHQQGVKTHVLLNKESSQTQYFNSLGISTTEYTIDSKFDKRAVKLIKELIMSHQIDIIYAFNNNATSNAVKAVKDTNVKLISYRGFTGHVHWYKPSSLLSHLNKRVSRVSCVSNAVRNQVRKQLWRNKHKAVTIYKGHNMDWYNSIEPTTRLELGIPESAFLVGIVANLRTMKGVKYFIKAANYLAGNYDIHFMMIGRGMDSPEVKTLIDKTPLKENFHTWGYRNDVLNAVAACDVAVNSSIKGEGLSKTTIEAMCLRVPVIATSIGGNPELVVNMQTGLLIPPKSPKAIANAILQYKTDKTLMTKMAENGRDFIQKNITVEKTASETLKVYKELMKEAGKLNL